MKLSIASLQHQCCPEQFVLPFDYTVCRAHTFRSTPTVDYHFMHKVNSPLFVELFLFALKFKGPYNAFNYYFKLKLNIRIRASVNMIMSISKFQHALWGFFVQFPYISLYLREPQLFRCFNTHQASVFDMFTSGISLRYVHLAAQPSALEPPELRRSSSALRAASKARRSAASRTSAASGPLAGNGGTVSTLSFPFSR